MNFLNRFFLRLALLPSSFYSRLGADIPQLRAILTAKLTMDDRRTGALTQARRRGKNKPVSRATLLTMLISAVMGIFFLLAFSIGSDMATHLTIYFALFFFMLAATLISDFTSVLIDVRDTFIILPKPVSDRTFLLARLLHILIHICKIVLPMTVPALVKMAMETGPWGAVLFLVLAGLVTLFSLFFINALYIIILRVTTPERFRNAIAYIQIAFAIVMYGSYQVVPRLMGRFSVESFTLVTKPGIQAFPFYWFGAAWNALYTGRGHTADWIAGALAFAVPLLSIFLVVRYLAPSFNNRLALINGSGEGGTQESSMTSSRPAYARGLARFVTRNATERTGFLFTWALMGRSRDFKLKVYPSIGYLAVYGVLMFLRSGVTMEGFANEERKERALLLTTLYFSSFILTRALSQLAFSEKYKAAWFFHITPLHPGDVILGAMKAALLKFYIPLAALIAAAAILVVGPHVIPNILLGFFNQLLISTFLVWAGHRAIPFSMPVNNSARGGGFLRALMLLVLMGFVGVGHYLVYTVWPVVVIFLAMSAVATGLMMAGIRETGWGSVRSGKEEF
jgi:ABC-2 type transport system permease protein